MKKAFTLVEVMIVTAIISLLCIISFTAYNAIHKNNSVDNCEMTLRDIASGYQSYIIDYGKINLAATSSYETAVNNVLSVLNRYYFNDEVECTGIDESGYKSFEAKTKIKMDPWGNPYYLSVYTYDGEDSDNVVGLMVIHSNGPDGVSSADTYSESKCGDDVIAIVKPNN
ncbi:MAG: prepilin-type N-terminal cleavage/methylation domain-containing protein [Clostridiales bacterium]|nr:prepilin-type N-terminal cleavage/methylation domain-containing protein [Clostridiales bacterium]